MDVPDLIGNAKVIFYATAFIDDTKISFAICKYDNTNGFYLFRCNYKWIEFSDTWHESVEDAQDQANYQYKIKPINWIAK